MDVDIVEEKGEISDEIKKMRVGIIFCFDEVFFGVARFSLGQYREY